MKDSSLTNEVLLGEQGWLSPMVWLNHSDFILGPQSYLFSFFFFLRITVSSSSLHNFQPNRKKQIKNNRGMWSWSLWGFGSFPSASWRRQWQPTPVLLPGKSHGWRSLVGWSPWGSRRVGLDWATSLSLFTCMHWRRKWQPTPVFLPGESHGQGSLVGCHLWGRTESDTTEAT